MAWWEKLGSGKRIVRAATLTLAAATTPLFTVLGGKVQLTAIIGTITTIIGGAANYLLQFNPTVGTATTTPLCIATNINAYPVGDLLGITGVPIDPMIPVPTGGGMPGMTMPWILPTGQIEAVCDAAPGGAVLWELFYKPLDNAAYVIAA